MPMPTVPNTYIFISLKMLLRCKKIQQQNTKRGLSRVVSTFDFEHNKMVESIILQLVN